MTTTHSISYIVTNKPEYLKETLSMVKPEYVFFPFWSWKVSKEITSKHRCICFHEGIVPDHAGGSPIQNLIRLGMKETIVNAIVMNDTIDGGEIILQRPLSLDGNLDEILLRDSKIIGEMIDVIQKNNL